MLVAYNTLPATSKVWVYQSNRAFEPDEVVEIEEQLTQFINSWKRHGEDLKASYLIKYNQFIVLLVDEDFNEVSGCSIDASVNLIKQLEAKFSVDLTNKLNISFKDGDNINVVSMAHFKEYIKQGKITSATIVFNNMVNTKDGFEKNWEVTAANSWHKRFL